MWGHYETFSAFASSASCIGLMAPVAAAATTSLSGAEYFAVCKVSDDETTDDQTEFEVACSYAVNDNVTIKPGFFTVEETTPNKEDDSGVVLETTFSF